MSSWWTTAADSSSGSWMRSVRDYQEDANESTMFLAPGVDRQTKKGLRANMDGKPRLHWMRRCTDFCCIIPFMLLVALMIYTSVSLMGKAQVERLHHGTDYAGRLCGVDAAVKAKPFLYYCPGTIDPTETEGVLQKVDEDGKVREQVNGGPVINKNVLAGFGVPYALNLADPICVARCPDGSGAADPCIAEFSSIPDVTQRDTLLKTLPSPTKMTAYATKGNSAGYCMPDLDFIAALAITYEQRVPDGLRGSIEDGAIGGDWKLKASRSIGGIRDTYYTKLIKIHDWEWNVILFHPFLVLPLLSWIYSMALWRYEVKCLQWSLMFMMFVFLGLGIFILVCEFLSRPPERSLANRPAVLDEEGTFTQQQKIERVFEVIRASFNDRWDGKEVRKFYEDVNPFYQDTISAKVARVWSIITAVVCILFGLKLAVIRLCYATAQTGKEMLKVSKDVVTKTPLMWLRVPLRSTILKTIVFLVSLHVLTALVMSGKVERVELTTAKSVDIISRVYTWDSVLKIPGEVLIGLFVLGTFWLIEIIQGQSQFAITWATIQWYFTPLVDGTKAPNWTIAGGEAGERCCSCCDGCCGGMEACCGECCISCSYFCLMAQPSKIIGSDWGTTAAGDAKPFQKVKWANLKDGYTYSKTFHLGTILKGSFNIMLFRFARLLVRMSRKFSDAIENSCIGFLTTVFNTCCTCAEDYLMLCDKDAYISTALFFEDFFTAAGTINDYFEQAGETVSYYRGACTIFTAVGVMFVSMISFFLTLFFYVAVHDAVISPLAIALIAAIFSGYITYEFVAMVDVASDTLLVTYIWNKNQGHATVGKYAPGAFLDLMCYRPIEADVQRSGLDDLARLNIGAPPTLFETFFPWRKTTKHDKAEKDIRANIAAMEDQLDKSTEDSGNLYNLQNCQGWRNMWKAIRGVYCEGHFKQDDGPDWDYWGRRDRLPPKDGNKGDIKWLKTYAEIQKADKVLETQDAKKIKIVLSKSFVQTDDDRLDKLVEDRWNGRYDARSAPMDFEFKLHPKGANELGKCSKDVLGACGVLNDDEKAVVETMGFNAESWNKYVKSLLEALDYDPLKSTYEEDRLKYSFRR